MNFSAGTGPVLVRQVTVAVSFNPVITQDMVVSEPFFTSLFTDSTSEINNCQSFYIKSMRSFGLKCFKTEDKDDF